MKKASVNKMIDIDKKRKLDSDITKAFLSDSLNKEIVFKMVHILGKEISQSSKLGSLSISMQ